MSRLSRHEQQLAELNETLSNLRPKVQEMSARLISSAVALEDADAKLNRLYAVCRRIAALHAPHAAGPHQLCVTCRADWPCPTASALQELVSE